MKKFLAVVVALTVLVGVANVVYAEFKKFNVYTDANARDNHYVPSGYMGDANAVKLDNMPIPILLRSVLLPLQLNGNNTR